jgi:4-hydroxy-tetrahydrodipicolinate synthase
MSEGRFGTKYDRLFVALITPMKENLEIDELALRKLLRYFMQPKFVGAGGAIIINPEAGEIFCMNREEKRRNVEIAMEECGGKVPVFAGVLDVQTGDSVKVAVDAKEAGAEGLFLLPPMGSMDISLSWDSDKYPEVWVDMAKAQVEAVDLPAIVHPSARLQYLHFGTGLPPSATIQMCKEIPNIVGWKMTYSYQGGLIISRALKTLPRHIGILRAGANYFHEHLAAGYFDGTVSGSFNYGMESMIDHISAWKNRNINDAYKIWKSGLEDLHFNIYVDYSRIHIKYKVATWLRGLIPTPIMRPPMPKPRKEEVLTLKHLLIKAGFEVIPDKDINHYVEKLPR